MDLSIIIISWNVQEKLKENLEALFKSKVDFEFEVFVVDNASSDDSVKMIKDNFPNVKLIENKDNLGFAKANNIAIKQASGEYILLLNPDMRVLDDTLVNMLKWMKDNPRASVAGCKLINDQGILVKHVRRFPNIWNQLLIILKLPHLFSNILKKYLREDFDYDRPQVVDSIRGSFFMIRRPSNQSTRSLFLDERYFVWFEEVDYCKQVSQCKEEVWYTPSVACINYTGESFNQVATYKKQLYMKDSMLKYFKKWHPVWQCYLLRFVWVIGLFFVRLGNLINIKSKAKT